MNPILPNLLQEEPAGRLTRASNIARRTLGHGEVSIRNFFSSTNNQQQEEVAGDEGDLQQGPHQETDNEEDEADATVTANVTVEEAPPSMRFVSFLLRKLFFTPLRFYIIVGIRNCYLARVDTTAAPFGPTRYLRTHPQNCHSRVRGSSGISFLLVDLPQFPQTL